MEVQSLYQEIAQQLASLFEGERDVTANLANASAVIKEALPDINWAGFYLMKDNELVLGPFQGKPACIRIPMGKGVCGTAAQLDQVQRVEDVHTFSGHIACDSASKSEIVLPLHWKGRVAGVLDIDSPVYSRFSTIDEEGLQRCAQLIENACDWQQLQLSGAGDNPLLTVVPPADCRGAQMKAPSERAPHGNYVGDVLENKEERNKEMEKKWKWCAIGDSFTYLNDHLDETGYRVAKGYLSRIQEQLPQLELNNIGINGSTIADWTLQPIPFADIYTILLGTNDWNALNPLGTQKDFQKRTHGTILGNYAVLLDHIRQTNPKAKIIAGNPVERADFVYLLDPYNNAEGSYTEKNGLKLSFLADALIQACRSEGIEAVDLNQKSGFTQESVIRFKRVKKDGCYQELPYPEYVGLPFDPASDDYPYPPEAAGMTYDGLHPTDYGNQVIADLFTETIREWLDEQK